MADNACFFHQYGHCKFGSHCRKNHTKETCSNFPCTLQTCVKRHPKLCRYFVMTGQCKFNDTCSFLHKQHNSEEVLSKQESEIVKLKEEIEALKKHVGDLQAIVDKMSNCENLRKSKVLDSTYTPSSTSSLTTLEHSTAENQFYHHIPQLDGDSHSHPLVPQAHNLPQILPSQSQQSHQPPFPPYPCAVTNNCENCGKIFNNETELKEHLDKHEYGCDECFICYRTKFHVDLHELEKHPESDYARDHIPYTTKLQFSAGCRVPTSTY